MDLKLTKPLVFLDIEATGINVAQDRIVELCLHKINPDDTRETLVKRINPEIPIPLEVSEIHGIYDIDIVDEPTFKEASEEIHTFLDKSDLAGFNSNRYDVPLLVEEFLRCGIDFDMTDRKLVDVQNIFHKMEQRTLSAAYKFYCNKELVDAHSAEADTLATFDVLMAQLDKYDNLSKDVDFLHNFSERHKHVDFMGRITQTEKGLVVFNFGKYKGQEVTEVLKKDPAYYGWMMKGDFPAYTKKVLTNIKESM